MSFKKRNHDFLNLFLAATSEIQSIYPTLPLPTKEREKWRNRRRQKRQTDEREREMKENGRKEKKRYDICYGHWT